MARKPDTIGYKEFNKLTDHKKTHHAPLPSEVLFEDENNNQLEETLMGMEYELEDMDELADEDPNDEIDESALYKGNQI